MSPSEALANKKTWFFKNYYNNNSNSLGDNVKFEFMNYVFNNNSSNCEEIVKNYYLNQGFNVFKFNEYFNNDMEKTIAKLKLDNANLLELIYKLKKKLHFKTVGMPDLLITDKVYPSELYFFVEVKSKYDGIKVDQIKWYLDNPDVPIKIVFVNLFKNNEIRHVDIKKNSGYKDLIFDLCPELIPKPIEELKSLILIEIKDSIKQHLKLIKNNIPPYVKIETQKYIDKYLTDRMLKLTELKYKSDAKLFKSRNDKIIAVHKLKEQFPLLSPRKIGSILNINHNSVRQYLEIDPPS